MREKWWNLPWRPEDEERMGTRAATSGRERREVQNIAYENEICREMLGQGDLNGNKEEVLTC